MDHHEKLPEAVGKDVYSLHPNFTTLEPEDIRRVQAAGLLVYAWTINTDERMKQALENGVDGIITDYPGKLLALMEGTGTRA